MQDRDEFAYITKELQKNNIVLFMKGTPEFPQCGFSGKVVEILNELNVKFHTIDVLQNTQLRQDIKEFSDWPTIPQLYVNGKFLGGCDIIQELHRSNELHKIFI